MRNKFNLNEEEKNRIRGLHLNESTGTLITPEVNNDMERKIIVKTVMRNIIHMSVGIVGKRWKILILGVVKTVTKNTTNKVKKIK